MRVTKLQIRIAMLVAVALSFSACQSAQRPASLLPARTAPALTSTVPAPVSTAQQTPARPLASPPERTQVQAAVETKAPASQTQAPSPTQSSDPVGDLITRVEKDFQAGLDAYKAGQTDAAKRDFDNAFNALLESNLDVRSDQRLEKEFDRVVEGVNHLDLGSLASDSDAQKPEPAPIDETNGITPSAD